jgi:molybdopterin molybdotransferase
MVSVSEATEIILKNIVKPSVESVSLYQAAGRVLAEKIVADRDFPPFNRVAMDGIAIVFNTFLKGQRQFSVQDIQAAGEPAKTLKDSTACIEIMTGAVLPEGADTIIRYEDVEIKDKMASITINDVIKGQNVHAQGQDAKQQDVLLEPHILLSAAEIALLASVGKSMVDVLVFPRVAIVASGDELVDVEDTPALHQIRRSNS